METKYNYSLIIPHHNSPELLERLLKTVPLRSDLQVIVVDDCSTKYIEMYENLKTRYGNVNFYSTGINGGAGKARNIGLSHADGRYVFFADSDDYFTPGINNLLQKYSNTEGVDIIYYNAQAVDSETYLPDDRAKYLNKQIELYRSKPVESELNLKFLFGEPWCKIISKSLIDKYDVKFDEIPVHNDTLFSYMTGYCANKIIVDCTVAYCVTKRTVSVSSFAFKDKSLIREEVFAKKNKFLKDNNINIFDNFMLIPFYENINKKEITESLFSIANRNGYHKSFILKKLTFYLTYRTINKLIRNLLSIFKLNYEG